MVKNFRQEIMNSDYTAIRLRRLKNYKLFTFGRLLSNFSFYTLQPETADQTAPGSNKRPVRSELFEGFFTQSL
jgi:hypothetical protein